MKKAYLLMLVLMISSASLFSQDFIYLKNGDRIGALISEITKTAIIYTDYGSADQKLQMVSNADVKMIAYANGKVSDFAKEKVKVNNEDFKKNLIAYHLADLLINNLTISYERISKDGKIGVQIPVSFGYSDNYQELGDFTNTFYSGINLNFYPTAQGTIRYFLGPGLRLGQGTYESYNNCYDCYESYSSEDLFYFKFHLNNGVMFTPIPSLSLVAELSLGIRYVDSKWPEEKVRTTGAFSFNMIYRF